MYSDWNVSAYFGQFYDSTPIKALQGFRDTDFESHYMVAAAVGKTVWKSQQLPLALEIEGLVGQQFGKATITEVAVAPIIRWDGFPWSETLPTSLRVGPLGVSWLSKVSPLEPNREDGSQWLNYLVAEIGIKLPNQKSGEIFARLHHRCTLFELLGDDVKNGEDFFGFGYRHHF